MGDVIVGVDRHKKSVTIEALDEQESVLATGRFGTTTRDYTPGPAHPTLQAWRAVRKSPSRKTPQTTG